MPRLSMMCKLLESFHMSVYILLYVYELSNNFPIHSRLYLCNSPAVRADNLRFKEEGVRDVLKDVFLPWYNAYRFLMQNVERLERVRW